MNHLDSIYEKIAPPPAFPLRKKCLHGQREYGPIRRDKNREGGVNMLFFSDRRLFEIQPNRVEEPSSNAADSPWTPGRVNNEFSRAHPVPSIGQQAKAGAAHAIAHMRQARGRSQNHMFPPRDRFAEINRLDPAEERANFRLHMMVQHTRPDLGDIRVGTVRLEMNHCRNLQHTISTMARRGWVRMLALLDRWYAEIAFRLFHKRRVCFIVSQGGNQKVNP
jgi:hypothetical protein